MGYGAARPPASQLMAEIARLVLYGGVTYARLERSGVEAPVDQLR